MAKSKKQIETLYWDHEHGDLTPKEWLEKFIELIESPLRNTRDLDGDMWMSDYRKLLDALNHIRNRDHVTNTK